MGRIHARRQTVGRLAAWGTGCNQTAVSPSGSAGREERNITPAGVGRCDVGIPEDMKAWIDKANYQALLARWRSAPVGSPWFRGEVGNYYADMMMRRRPVVGNDAHVSARKAMGREA